LCYAIKFGKNAFNKSIKLSASSKIRHFDPIFGINIKFQINQKTKFLQKKNFADWNNDCINVSEKIDH